MQFSADRLREFRVLEGFSQRDLAEKSGVSERTIERLEMGHQKPYPFTLRKLAPALGVEVRDFYDMEMVEERSK